ncbi:MAG: efflux RND transporter periplasmic adaptor subunit [Hyphomicrobiales bacterium]|nr:efflux RND transporter periplasmic adaptor subunit [Hyphomicrobiales bacterium]MCP4999291.1 efflux RND transporter periplasmic adaptor subunit [Hyphomicrobiales bacterium]
MTHCLFPVLSGLTKVLALFAVIQFAAMAASAQAETFSVVEQEVDDFKSVFARVQSRDRANARVRTGGTVAELNVDEGDFVESGAILAVVVDPKIALRIQAVDARISALESRLETAEADYARAQQLVERNVISQARLDQLKTAFDSASNDLIAARAERSVIEREADEGAVLAPASGRVLSVSVTEGSVILRGETVATIAANDYLLRLEVPERHARFISKGDPIRVGARGLEGAQEIVGEGHIVQVYPELQGGRVVADAEATGLGDYFVGERAQIWISAGKRRTFVIPADFLFKRHGLNYVRLMQAEGPPLDVVVQPGLALPDNNGPARLEILSGVRSGDELIRP